MEFTVTLADLRKAEACLQGYNKVVRSLQGKPFTDADAERDTYIKFEHKEPVSLLSILGNNGLDDALWALRCVKNVDRDARLFAVWCARQVQHLMPDQSSIDALDVAERFANGLATREELATAWAAARAVARAVAWHAAWHAAWYAAWYAARDGEGDDAWGAARAAQKEMFVKMCNGQAPWQLTGKITEMMK